MKSREPSKDYFRIGEVSEVVGVEPHVLRYWESEFPTIRPKKSSTGQRVYSRQDVDKLLRVKELLRNQGFSIAGARKRLREAPGPEEQLAVASAVMLAPKEPAQKKSVRKQLLGLRREILQMLEELSPAEKGRGRRAAGHEPSTPRAGSVLDDPTSLDERRANGQTATMTLERDHG